MMGTTDPTILIMCLNMLLASDLEEHTKQLIRQSLFAYGMMPQEVTEGELRAKGILEDRRKQCQ